MQAHQRPISTVDPIVHAKMREPHEPRFPRHPGSRIGLPAGDGTRHEEGSGDGEAWVEAHERTMLR